MGPAHCRPGSGCFLNMKRRLYLLHRYIGIGLGLPFALWFASGVVMLYAQFPILTPEARFSGLPRFHPDRFTLPPHDAVERAGLSAPPRRIRLGMLLDRPIYYILPAGQPWLGVYADTGRVLASVDEATARHVARRHAPAGAHPELRDVVETLDQWTLSNSLNLHRPLYRFELGDERGTEVYVSAQTGEMVMRTTRRERLLSWLGPIIHWGAPAFFRQWVGPWRQTMLWVSAVGTLLVITGVVIGILRYRRRGYVLKGVDATRRVTSPYLGVKRRHHWAGLIAGIVTLTWITSGLLYLNPGGRRQDALSTTTQMTPYSVGGVRGSTSARPGQAEAMRGGPLDPSLWVDSPETAWARVGGAGATEALQQDGLPKEAELRRFAGRPYYVFQTGVFESVTVAADGSGDPPVVRHPTEALVARARQAVEGPLLTATLLERYDAYYYSVGSGARRRLPVLRLTFDDPGTRLLYVDPHTGAILRAYDTRAKVMRWAVMGLHCLDFPFLIRNRPVWDITIISLSLGGLLLSVTGVVMSWRRIRPRRRRTLSMDTLPNDGTRPRVSALLLLVCLGSAATAAAQPGGASQPADPQRRFEEVVVTATLDDERVRDVPVTMQTFDREEIEQSMATTVTEFLSERGVAFFSTWTPGQTSINIRGGATDGQGRDFRSQVVVLINGRRAGTANISKLGLYDVERIEVLRGPGGLVYGSQALGGVINLITKDGLRSPGSYVRLSGGSWGFVESVAQHGGSHDKWDYFVSAHGGRRDDYEAGAGAVETPMRNTAYQQGGGLLSLGYTPNAFQRVTITARADGMYDAGFRGSSWDWDNDENRTNRSVDVVYGGDTRGGRASWEIQSSYFRDLDDLRWGAEVRRSSAGPIPGVDLDHNRRRQKGFFVRGLTNVGVSGSNDIHLGVDSQWWQLRSTRVREPLPGRTASQVGPFDNNSDSRNVGIFVEDVQHLLDDRLILRGGVRFDGGRHQIRETPNRSNLVERAADYDAVTYRVGATLKPADTLAFRFSVGTGYRAPNATELAVDYTTVLGSQILGNPDLEPEQATSVEVGVAYERDRAWIDLALFRNDITNRIQAVGEHRAAFVRVYQNRAESELVGLELQSRFEVARLGDDTRVSIGVNAAHHFRMRDLDAAARNLSTDRIIRVYKTQGSALLGVTNPSWMVQLVGTYYGRVWYDTEENLLIPFAEPARGTIHAKAPFMTWKLRSRYPLADGMWLTAAVHNLFDKNEHPLFIAINREPLFANTAFSNGGVGNSMPGRAFIVGLEWRP